VVTVFAHENQAEATGNRSLARVETAEHETSKLEGKSQETGNNSTRNKSSHPKEQKKGHK
jgi:hypothetical protein